MSEILVIKYNRPLDTLPANSVDIKRKQRVGTIIDNKWLITREHPATSLAIDMSFLDIISSPREIKHLFFSLIKIEDGRYYYRVHTIKADISIFEELTERVHELEYQNKQLSETISELQQELMWWEERNERK